MTDRPTIYEFMGGQDVLLRLADAHYRRCLQDPTLTHYFGTAAHPEHVEHLAAWLGEVFGGPTTYTDQHGGHGALLRHHANLNIAEDARQRFVEVFIEAADEVGLPADETFRRRLVEYLEWGTAIAVEVSKPGADISTSDPVPRWGWS
jgi:hemoglobin